MIREYSEAVNYILDIPRFADKSGPSNVKRLMELLGNPESSFDKIHIAGTNGKGSVARILSGTFREAGLKTGLFVSPHLVRINERISVNGIDISDDEFLDCFNSVMNASERLMEEGGSHPSFFEFVFAMGMVHFENEKTDIAVIETGLGGRLDATNVIIPVASVITSIGFDHMQYLGDTIEKIAAEKAGIIKPGVPVICNTGNEAADRVMEETAGIRKSPLINAGKTRIYDVKYRTDSPQIDFSAVNCYYNRIGITINSMAYYEVINAVTAMETIRAICADATDTAETGNAADKIYTEERLYPALLRSLKGFELPGRMQYIEKNVILDGAHNENAVRHLGQSLEMAGIKVRRILFAVSEDKDYRDIAEGILKYIRPDEIYITETHGKRKLAKSTLADAFVKVTESAGVSVTGPADGSAAEAAGSVTKAAVKKTKIKICEHRSTAYREAREGLGEDDILLVTGSFYLLGDIL